MKIAVWITIGMAALLFFAGHSWRDVVLIVGGGSAFGLLLNISLALDEIRKVLPEIAHDLSKIRESNRPGL
jgi:hypothetical protein